MRSQKPRRMRSRSTMTQNMTASSRHQRRVKQLQARERLLPNQKHRRRVDYRCFLCAVISCIWSSHAMVGCLHPGSGAILDRIDFVYSVASLFLYHSVKLNTLIHNTFQRDDTIVRQISDPQPLRANPRSHKGSYRTAEQTCHPHPDSR